MLKIAKASIWSESQVLDTTFMRSRVKNRQFLKYSIPLGAVILACYPTSYFWWNLSSPCSNIYRASRTGCSSACAWQWERLPMNFSHGIGRRKKGKRWQRRSRSLAYWVCETLKLSELSWCNFPLVKAETTTSSLGMSQEEIMAQVRSCIWWCLRNFPLTQTTFDRW